MPPRKKTAPIGLSAAAKVAKLEQTVERMIESDHPVIQKLRAAASRAHAIRSQGVWDGQHRVATSTPTASDLNILSDGQRFEVITKEMELEFGNFKTVAVVTIVNDNTYGAVTGWTSPPLDFSSDAVSFDEQTGCWYIPCVWDNIGYNIGISLTFYSFSPVI